jgi:hypothetical protein
MNTKSLSSRVDVKLWQLKVAYSPVRVPSKNIVFMIQVRPLGKENIIFNGLVNNLSIFQTKYLQ